MAYIRYFCRVTPEPGDAIGDLSFAWFRRLVDMKLGFGISVVPTNCASPLEGRWKDIYPSQPDDERIGEMVLNVVCGDAEELKRLWTAKTKNIAITVVAAPSTLRLKMHKYHYFLSDAEVPAREQWLSWLPDQPFHVPTLDGSDDELHDRRRRHDLHDAIDKAQTAVQSQDVIQDFHEWRRLRQIEGPSLPADMMLGAIIGAFHDRGLTLLATQEYLKRFADVIWAQMRR